MRETEVQGGCDIPEGEILVRCWVKLIIEKKKEKGKGKGKGKEKPPLLLLFRRDSEAIWLCLPSVWRHKPCGVCVSPQPGVYFAI